MSPRHTDDTEALSRCPIETTIAVIGGRWKPLILYHLRRGPTRFNALRRLIPAVTQRMLTLHLRELERDGIIGRTVYPGVPAAVEYALTAKGVSLEPVLVAMTRWAEQHGDDSDTRRAQILQGPDAGHGPA